MSHLSALKALDITRISLRFMLVVFVLVGVSVGLLHSAVALASLMSHFSAVCALALVSMESG